MLIAACLNRGPAGAGVVVVCKVEVPPTDVVLRVTVELDRVWLDPDRGNTVRILEGGRTFLAATIGVIAELDELDGASMSCVVGLTVVVEVVLLVVDVVVEVVVEVVLGVVMGEGFCVVELADADEVGMKEGALVVG